MSATRYKRMHVDIFICIEMARERNSIMKKNTPSTLKIRNKNIKPAYNENGLWLICHNEYGILRYINNI